MNYINLEQTRKKRLEYYQIMLDSVDDFIETGLCPEIWKPVREQILKKMQEINDSDICLN